MVFSTTAWKKWVFSPVDYDSKNIGRIMSSETQRVIHWLNLFGDPWTHKDELEKAWERKNGWKHDSHLETFEH